MNKKFCILNYIKNCEEFLTKNPAQTPKIWRNAQKEHESSYWRFSLKLAIFYERNGNHLQAEIELADAAQRQSQLTFPFINYAHLSLRHQKWEKAGEMLMGYFLRIKARRIKYILQRVQKKFPESLHHKNQIIQGSLTALNIGNNRHYPDKGKKLEIFQQVFI